MGMILTRALWKSQADLLAADTTGFANASANKLALYTNNVALNLDMVLGDFTLATFTGSTPLSLGTGVQPTFIDAGDGQYTMMLKDPAGGIVWNCTVTPGSPETCYGVIVTDNAGATLLGASAFDTPQIVSASGQSVVVGDVMTKFSEASPH